MPFAVQACRDDGWRAVSTPDTLPQAVSDAAGERQRSGPRVAVRIVGPGEVQLRLWPASGTPVPDASGPSPTLR